MGLWCSSSANRVGAAYSLGSQDVTFFATIGLDDKRLLKRLMKVFRRGDRDGSGEIDMFEFCMLLDIERTPFAERAFGAFDADGSGQIDYREFVMAARTVVVVLWPYYL